MKRLILIYTLGSLVLFAPLALKALATGSVGPQTTFYFFTAWAPLTILATGWLLGKVYFGVHAVFIISIGLMTWVGYPADPIMDLMRQTSHEMSNHFTQYALWLILMDFAINIVENRETDHASQA